MPMPGGEGGAMPMMPMAGSNSMAMPNFDAMMDSGMGTIAMAPPMNIQMIMPPPPPPGMEGMPMMPMPGPGPAAAMSGSSVGEAPAGVAGNIGNERNESFISQPEVLANVPASALANLSPEQVQGVNAVFQDNGSGIAIAPPIPNSDGTFNQNPFPGGFIIAPGGPNKPGGEGFIVGPGDPNKPGGGGFIIAPGAPKNPGR